MLTQFNLKNKLKVLLVESRKAPVVAVQMWVKTGSADEKKKEEGISHFIEHLVFKGTRKYDVGEIAKVVEGSGGELNAYTTFDQTVFHVTVSRDYLDVGLDSISEMMGFPKFDPVEIDREREVVLEEIKRSDDNPHQVSAKQLFSTVFKKHPYGIPVIGYAKNIETVSPKKLRQYFQDRYVPSNMTLVVAGDFETKEIKNKINQFFGSFQNYRLKKVKRNTEPKQLRPQAAYSVTEFKEASFNIAFRIPPAKHADVPALDVLGYILGQGDSSRLVKRLRLEEPLVIGVNAGTYNPVDPGLFAIGVYLKVENYQRIMQVISEEIVSILTGPPTYEELNRARLNLEAEEIYSLETVDGLANKVGMFQLLMNDPGYVQKYLREVQKLKPSDILKVARKYLKASTLSVTMMLGKEDEKILSEKDFKKSVTDLAGQLNKAAATRATGKDPKTPKTKKLDVPLKVKEVSSEIIKERLSNGALVIMKRNSGVPIVHTKAGFLGGLRAEEDNNQGVTFLLSNTWTAGTKNHSESEIASAIEGCAGSLSAFGGRNSIGLTFESLKVHEAIAKNLFQETLLEPLFPQTAVERERVIQLEHIRTRFDHPSSLVSQDFMQATFKDHPYSRDTLGTEESVKRLNSDMVKKHFDRIVTSKNAVLVAVGDIKPDEQLRYFEEITSGLPTGEALGKPVPIAPLSKDVFTFSKSEKEQTHIVVGYRGVSFTDPDRYSLHVLQAILAGQGGRLFIELRDKASLAYTVSPVHMEGIETGYFGVYIACSPEKGKTAVKMIHQELQKILSDAPPLDEVERAKKYLIGRNHIDLQKNSVQASSILFDELYGVDCRETFMFAERLRQISPADINRVARRILSQPAVSSAVGPVEPW